MLLPCSSCLESSCMQKSGMTNKTAACRIVQSAQLQVQYGATYYTNCFCDQNRHKLQFSLHVHDTMDTCYHSWPSTNTSTGSHDINCMQCTDARAVAASIGGCIQMIIRSCVRHCSMQVGLQKKCLPCKHEDQHKHSQQHEYKAASADTE